MNWNTWIRQVHRWMSLAFTASIVIVVISMIAAGEEESESWVVYLPLFPLAFLLVTGLYLFVLPHATKWRSGQRTVREV
jgi:ABC-type polysaccharide/polyol phosphate export permease